MANVDSITQQMDEMWGLTDEKLANMMAVLSGEIIITPDIGDCYPIKIVHLPDFRKMLEKGAKGFPVTASPVFTDENREKLTRLYGYKEGEVRTFFINKATFYQIRPWIAKLGLRGVESLAGHTIVLCGEEWKDAKAESQVRRDGMGRAISLRIREVKMPEAPTADEQKQIDSMLDFGMGEKKEENKEENKQKKKEDKKEGTT